MANWNPWHGCRKYSEGCQNCYVYRIDSAHGKDASQIFLNREFDLPMRRGRKGYLLAPGTKVYTCFSSDFFLEEADGWRPRVCAITAGCWTSAVSVCRHRSLSISCRPVRGF